MVGGRQCMKALGGLCNNATMAAAREGRIQIHTATSSSGLSKANANPKSKSKDSLASPSSQLGKFLGVPEVRRSETSVLLSKFIKLHTRQNPGIRKDGLCEEKLQTVMKGKDTVGITEIIKLLSQKSVRTV